MKKIIKNLVLCMICLIGIGSVSYSVYLYCSDYGRRMTLQTHYSKKDGC